jgi:hypothetical protein
MPRTLSAIILGGLAATMAVAPALAAPARTVVLYTSVAGVRLGSTPAQVRHKLGKPSHTTKVSGRIAEYDYYGVSVSVQFDTLHKGDIADFVGTTGGRFHTSKGVHVGTTQKALKRAYKGIRCKDSLCTLYKGHPGAVGEHQTDFDIFHGKVESIDVQAVYSP